MMKRELKKGDWIRIINLQKLIEDQPFIKNLDIKEGNCLLVMNTNHDAWLVRRSKSNRFKSFELYDNYQCLSKIYFDKNGKKFQYLINFKAQNLGEIFEKVNIEQHQNLNEFQFNPIRNNSQFQLSQNNKDICEKLKETF
jgi:hypothetical protein